jgi:hypothetical protein
MNHFAKKKTVLTLIVTLFAAATINPAFGQQKVEEVKIPETPVGKTFAAFLKAINSGDAETMKQFHKERNGNPANAEKDMEFYQRSGGFTVIEVTSSGDFALTATIETKKDSARLNFSMEVDSKAPFAIAGIRISQATN